IQGVLNQIELFDTETRFTLSDCVIISKFPSHLTLNKIRVNWRGSLKDMNAFVVGNKISVYAVLTPPKRPVFDGAYNFRRHAYFMGLSATGYCLGEPKMHPDSSKQIPSLARYRHNLTLKIRDALPGETGGLVVALVTGDRSGISNATKDYFAKSGVAHILAISGLHLSLIAGIFFLTIRRFLSLIPMLALRLPLKKIAAIFAWVGTLFYLMICDFPIPAERAFIMISIFFLSILLDREAISLRSVALSATIILILKPEALLNASFQLSFSAVAALVAFYEGGRYGGLAKIVHFIENKPIKYVLGLIITSLIASLATTPYIAYFFHHITLQSLTGNLLAVPLLGFVIMPLILVFLISLPFGGSSILNQALTYAFDLLTHYLEWVSRLAGASIPTGMIPWYALSLLTVSLLWLLLWHTRIRYGGILGICIASALIFTAPKPDLYIDPHRKLIAFYDPNSHQVIANSLQHARFARKVFMEASGTDKVIRIPSKPGLYRFGSLLFERQDNRLSIKRNEDYMEVGFNEEKLSHIILNGKEVDLPDLFNQGILGYWTHNTLSIKPKAPLHSTHPWE
ncbi:MAG: ComEC/Rec2 family competence protein, partial [Candidatus Nucleicultricaceae bacterium]